MTEQSRIILLDEGEHDRALLALALRSARSGVEVLEAASILDAVGQMAVAPVDAMVADPGAFLHEVSNLIAEIRRQRPHCAWWVFAHEHALPPDSECIGLGIDGRTVKSSLGYLKLPEQLFSRLRTMDELARVRAVELRAICNKLLPAAFCVLDSDGRFLWLNERVENMLEYPRYHLLGRTLTQLLAAAADRERWAHELHAARPEWYFNGELSTGLGTLPVVISLSLQREFAGYGPLWGAQLIDISTVSKADSDAAITPREDRDHLALALAHDLQAPLNSILSHAQSLQDAVSDNPDAQKTVTDMELLAKRLQHMLDGLAHNAQLGQDDSAIEMVSLDSVVEDAVENLRAEINRSGATVEKQALPTLRLRRHQMTQVFQNLVANAIKFQDNSTPRIKIRAEDTDMVVRIFVEDNGIGIDPRDTSRVFELFRRLHKDSEYPGIGVGLTICRQIIEAHGGEIYVDSEPGRGACFIIEFKGLALRTLRGERLTHQDQMS